ncbi:MAG: MarR family transcriptional regulator [Treponema sp.]|jgi:DNA-binding MarR family transcriptional regulator|nr:MarR family transcriptional regulator [Treponema sp.]
MTIVMAMDKRKLLTEKFYQVINATAQEMKTARDYGNGMKLHHSEVHALEAINNHEGANISELAGHMGVTIGAVWQVARKLKAKGLVESYRLKDNQKEVYFRLTSSGRIAREGHNRYHETLNADWFNFIDRLTESQTKVISDFFDEIVKSVGGTV